MKLQSLFENYGISYDPVKKKNYSSNVDFIKLNNIPQIDIQNAVDKILKSTEYAKVLALGYKLSSTAMQMKRGTLFFEAEDGSSQLTCYVTAQVRMANRSDDGKFPTQPIPTLPPTQIGDKPKAEDVLIENLRKALQAILNRAARQDTRKSEGANAVDERMKNFGFPEGFRIYIEGAEKNSKYISTEDGQIMIDAKNGGTPGRLVIDFGKNEEIGNNVNFGTVEGVWKVTLRGENIKTYKGLEKFFGAGLTTLEVDTTKPNFKELAKVMKAGAANLYFAKSPLEISLLSIPKIVHSRIMLSPKCKVKSQDAKNVDAVLDLLNRLIRKELDLFDVQDELINKGFIEAAKL